MYGLTSPSSVGWHTCTGCYIGWESVNSWLTDTSNDSRLRFWPLCQLSVSDKLVICRQSNNWLSTDCQPTDCSGRHLTYTWRMHNQWSEWYVNRQSTKMSAVMSVDTHYRTYDPIFLFYYTDSDYILITLILPDVYYHEYNVTCH